MNSTDLENAYNRALDQVEAAADDPDSADYRAALKTLEEVAAAGSVEAAEAIAELFALPGPHHDPEVAYRWYYVALSQQGYSVAFADQNHDPPYYGGPVGDFRNESMVSELVTDLGFERVKELDASMDEWKRARCINIEPST